MMTIASALDRNPLDRWAARRMGVAADALTREAITEYQLRAIRQTVVWARAKSAFYTARMAAFAADWPHSLEEFVDAPMTSPADIVMHGHAFVCLPQSEISRVVSLESSGTSGLPKRLFFTAEDQDLTLDFFAHGVSTMASEGGRMLIALPGEREGSVGYQLARGVSQAGVTPIPHGFVSDPSKTIQRMDRERVTLLIGLPVQMLHVAMECSETALRVFQRLHTIVLCSDHVPQSLVQRIREATGCKIFEHYGSTEMGLGGGVDCRVHAGYHLREADLYFEIVSPHTGHPVREGETGEVVFTTLGRHGMPLIRYRTGDLGRILPGACACGSPLRRLARVQNRIDGAVPIGRAGVITMAALDEALFAVPDVLDFAATYASGRPDELCVRIHARREITNVVAHAEHALLQLKVIAASCAAQELRLRIALINEPFPVSGAKRKIEVRHVQ